MDLHPDQFTVSQAGTRLCSIMPQSTCPTNTSNRTTCLSKLTQDISLLRSLTRGTLPPCSKLANNIGSILDLARAAEEQARQSFETIRLQQTNLENQLAAASRIANEGAREAIIRKLAADERLGQTEVETDHLRNQRVTDIRQIAGQQIRQAYAAAHQAEALAELQSQNFAPEMNYFKSELSDVLGHLEC